MTKLSDIPTAELPALVERGFPASEYVREMSFRHTYTILPVVDYDAQTIELRTFHNGIQERIHEVIRLKEAAVRSALIALGWTPPMGDA